MGGGRLETNAGKKVTRPQLNQQAKCGGAQRQSQPPGRQKSGGSWSEASRPLAKTYRKRLEVQSLGPKPRGHCCPQGPGATILLVPGLDVPGNGETKAAAPGLGSPPPGTWGVPRLSGELWSPQWIPGAPVGSVHLVRRQAFSLITAWGSQLCASLRSLSGCGYGGP